MSRKVIGLLASWKCQLEGHNILEVWRMAHLCLMCIWRKWNAKRFEDHAKRFEDSDGQAKEHYF
jgi:hypothetical protein